MESQALYIWIISLWSIYSYNLSLIGGRLNGLSNLVHFSKSLGTNLGVKILLLMLCHKCFPMIQALLLLPKRKFAT